MKRKHCAADLSNSTEHAKGEWFVRCLECGVKNVVVPGLVVVA
jgi:hypothetical protein